MIVQTCRRHTKSDFFIASTSIDETPNKPKIGKIQKVNSQLKFIHDYC